jgi:hypothetical protein
MNDIDAPIPFVKESEYDDKPTVILDLYDEHNNRHRT